jgi:hypothetical protein
MKKGIPMNFSKELVFTIAFASLLVATLAALPLLAKQKTQAGDRTDGNVGQNAERSEASQSEDYWTPERMQNAQPAPLERPGSPKPASQPQPPSGSEATGSSADSGEVPPVQQK